MLKLSASTLNLYLECPRCFWFTLNKKIQRPKGPFSSLPSGIDLVLKEYFNQFRQKGDLPDILKGKLSGRIIYPLPKSFRFYEPRLNALLFGQLDECLEIEKNFFAPLDHKTRGFPTKEDTHTFYQLEMDVYTLLLEENRYMTKKFGYLVFYYPVRGKSIKEGFPYETEIKKIPTDPERAKKIFSQAVEVLKKPEPPSYSESCPYCNWARAVLGY